MEFGSSARIDTGGGVVGLSWVAPSTHAEANLVLATSESRVAVVSADDRRLVASWLTRPGSYNKFTCAAIQNRMSRRFFCVQNHNRLFSWHEKDASLERATKLKLRGSVYALRQSKKLVPIAAVYVDGAVSLIAEMSAPADAKSSRGDAVVSLAEVAHAAGHTDGSIVTWARLTASPGDDRRFLLMLLMQQPLDADAVAASPPRLVVYVIQAGRGGASATGGSDDATSFVIKLAATHTLSQPDAPAAGKPRVGGADSGARVTALALHKMLAALTVVWATGHLQVLQFPHVSAWYMSTPTCSFTRKLARFLPGGATAPSSHAASDDDGEAFQCAAFALEPSCVVLAGTHGVKPGSGDVGLTVWDARYGVVIGSQHIDEQGDDTIIDDTEADKQAPAAAPIAAPAAAAAGRVRGSAVASTTSSERHRSDSVGSSSAPSSAVLNSSLLSSAQAISTAALTPDSVFQVTVSEDNSFVAIASRRRVLITAVAARGASLVSAINRMHHTRTMLASDDMDLKTSVSAAGAAMRAPPVPRMDMSSLLRSVLPPGGALHTGGVAWTGEQQTAWSAVVSSTAASTRDACEALLDFRRTPTAAHVLSIVAVKGDMSRLPERKVAPAPVPQVAATGDAGAAAGRKRRRSKSASRVAVKQTGILPELAAVRESLDSMNDDGEAAMAAIPADLLHGAPNSIIAAVTQRCMSALLAPTDDGASDDHDAHLNAVTVLRVLLHAGLLSALAYPHLLTSALTAITTASQADADERKKARTTGSSSSKTVSPRVHARVLLLVDILLHARDIPEASLVDAFVACVHRVPSSCLHHVWRSMVRLPRARAAAPAAASSSGKRAGKDAAPAEAGVAAAAPASEAPPAAKSLEPTAAASGTRVKKPRARGKKRAAAGAVATPAPMSEQLVAELTSTGTDIMGLLFFVALLVRAPRNDVFMEQALSSMSVDDAVILLAALHQLMHYCAHTLGTVATASMPPLLKDAGRYLPSLSQVLDWLRMTLDAHFTRLALAAKSPPGAHIGPLLQSIVNIIKEQAELAEAASSLRGQVLHVLARGKLPTPVPPEHVVQLVKL